MRIHRILPSVRTWLPALVICICAMASVQSFAKVPEQTPRFVMGMSTALSGPAADLGTNMQIGVEIAFQEANLNGGIQGEPISLIAYDDGYEPSQTIINMRRLIEQDNVLGIIGNVGTPTAIAAVPIASETRTPFIGAYSGADILRRSPPTRYVINYRASYAEETAAMVNALVKHAKIKPSEIAFFTQRDAYGDAGFIGGIQALKMHGVRKAKDIAHGRFERNTLSVEIGLAEIMLHQVPPKAIIMVGTYAPCAKFIQRAKAMDYDGLFLNVSFVGSVSLAKALGDDSNGVIITQVVPHPESDIPIAVQYREAMDRLDKGQHERSFGSLEGYIAARILLCALHSTHFTCGRESVIESFEALGKFEMGFTQPLELSDIDHQASHMVWPTMLRNSAVVSIEWSDLSEGNVHE